MFILPFFFLGMILARASYRLLPLIHVSQPIKNEDVNLFRSCFPSGVVDFEDDPSSPKSHKIVKIIDARSDTVSREVLRHAQFAEIVSLGRRRDHFICKVFSLCNNFLCNLNLSSIFPFDDKQIMWNRLDNFLPEIYCQKQ